MRYKAQLPDESVNVTTTNFLAEAFKLGVGLILTLALSYMLLVATLGVIIDNLNIEYEQKFHRFFTQKIQKSSKPTQQEKYIQSIVDNLNSCANLPYQLKVSISSSPQINAMAIIGGTIIITQGMLDAIKNENELTFVLGHEMGHFKHRDHLKGVSSGIALSLLAILLGESSSSNIINQVIEIEQMHYSKNQESRADTFGVDMLMCRYHSTIGASHLFARMTNEDRWSDFMLTHPNFSKRVRAIEEYIQTKGYRSDGELIKLKL